VCVCVWRCMYVCCGCCLLAPCASYRPGLSASSIRGCSPILILLLWRGAHTRQNQAKPHTYLVRPCGHAPDALFLIAPVGFQSGARKDPVCASTTLCNYPLDQSMIYVPLQVNRCQKCILLIVEYKYLKSCSGDFYSPESDPPHKSMRYDVYSSIQLSFWFHTDRIRHEEMICIGGIPVLKRHFGWAGP